MERHPEKEGKYDIDNVRALIIRCYKDLTGESGKGLSVTYADSPIGYKVTLIKRDIYLSRGLFDDFYEAMKSKNKDQIKLCYERIREKMTFLVNPRLL